GLGAEVHGLLAGAALAVDGGAGHVQGHAGGQPRGAADVAGLGADGVDAAEDHVVDDLGVDAGALDDGPDDVRPQVGRVLAGQASATLADGRADVVETVGVAAGDGVGHGASGLLGGGGCSHSTARPSRTMCRYWSAITAWSSDPSGRYQRTATQTVSRRKR